MTISPPAENHQQLLQNLARRPLHVASAFPFDPKGYDRLNLEGSRLPEVNTGNQELDQQLDSFNREFSGIVQMSGDSARDMGKSSLQGSIFGGITGFLISLIRFQAGIEDLSNPKRRAMGLFILLGFPLLGMGIGAITGAYQATKRAVEEFGDIAKNRLQMR